MDSAEQAGHDRSQYLIGFVLLAVAVLIGATAYFGLNSAKETVGKLDSALGSVGAAGNVPGAGIKEALPSIMNESQPAQEQGTLPAGDNGSGTATETGAQQPAQADKEVVIDFLYADGCSHCQKMKSVMGGLEELFPKDRFEVRYWNYDKQGEGEVGAMYRLYGENGYFTGGVPTFVANGNDSRVGEMPEATFKAWVCSKFSPPKPEGC